MQSKTWVTIFYFKCEQGKLWFYKSEIFRTYDMGDSVLSQRNRFFEGL